MGKFDSYFQNLHFNVRKHVVWAIWPGFGRRTPQWLIQFTSTERRRFSYARKKKRRNTREGRKNKLESPFQIRNKNSIVQ